jgi:hypothetical protein
MNKCTTCLQSPLASPFVVGPTPPPPPPRLGSPQEPDGNSPALEPLRTLLALRDWGQGPEGRGRVLAYLTDQLGLDFSDDEVGGALLGKRVWGLLIGGLFW